MGDANPEMTAEKLVEKKAILLACVCDGVGEVLYYDRKGDKELTVGDVKFLIESGRVTIAEMLAEFERAVRENFDVPK